MERNLKEDIVFTANAANKDLILEKILKEIAKRTINSGGANMNFEVDPVPRDETEKEQMYDLFVEKNKVLTRISLKDALERINNVMKALEVIPEKKEEKDKKK